MIQLPETAKIYLYSDATDMRKSIDTLSVLVSDVLGLNVGSGDLFLFLNRKRNKMKILYHEQNCFSLWYRRLEQGKFILPKDATGCIDMTVEHFNWLLASDKFSLMEASKKQKITDFY